MIKISAAWAAFFAVALLSAFYALPALRGGTEEETSRPVALSLWHVDTFEGGRGSRASFLRAEAIEYCRGRSDVAVLVSDYSVEGMREAFRRGVYPDMISFGVGAPVDPAWLQPMENLSFFAANDSFGNALAYPWCAGTYVVFSKTDDFSRLLPQTTAVSSGGSNLSATAFALHLSGRSGQSGAITSALSLRESLTAYTDFLTGKSEYLFGTQRDIYRFSARGVEVRAEIVAEYDDLYQYVAVTARGEATGKSGSAGKAARRECAAFVSYLLSEEVQKDLHKIGMFSLRYEVYVDGENAIAIEAEKVLQRGATPAVSAFISDDARKDAETNALAENTEVLKKFLKRR